jgi:microcystin-dependent protein
MGTVYDSDAIGTVKAWAGTAIPTNWMLADGRSLSKLAGAYPELFNAIGYTYGGSGNNFNLPNLTAKFIYGVADARPVAAGGELGASGGESTHALSIAEMPSHDHYNGAAGAATGGCSNRGGVTTAGDGAHYHEAQSGQAAYMMNANGLRSFTQPLTHDCLNCTWLDPLIYPSDAYFIQLSPPQSHHQRPHSQPLSAGWLTLLTRKFHSTCASLISRLTGLIDAGCACKRHPWVYRGQG